MGDTRKDTPLRREKGSKWEGRPRYGDTELVERMEIRRNGEQDTRGNRRGSGRDKGLGDGLILDTLFGGAPTVPWGGSGFSRRSGATVLSFSSPGPGRALAGPRQVQRLGQGLPQGRGLAQGLVAGPRVELWQGPRQGSEAVSEAGLRLRCQPGLRWAQGSGSWGTSGLAGPGP